MLSDGVKKAIRYQTVILRLPSRPARTPVWVSTNFLMKMLLRPYMPSGGVVICCRYDASAVSGA